MDNTVDLVQLASPVATKLPHDADSDFVLLAETLPSFPALMETEDLVIRRGSHNYGAWRIDYPQASATKSVYEALGVVTAAVLLKPELNEVTIRSTNPKSEVRELRIEFSHSDHRIGLSQTPTRFEYWPSEATRHPWLHELVSNPADYPHFVLNNSADVLATEEDWNTRDVLQGFGSARGTARMIQLFLDMSRQSTETTEIALECEAGFRGVAPASAEIRFWLPGGDFYES